MANNEVLTTPILLIALKQMGIALDSIDGQLNVNNETLKEIYKTLQNADITSMVKNDIMDSKALKRRLIRVQTMTGNKTNMITGWEHSLFSALGMNRREIMKSSGTFDFKTTLWDALDASPEYRSVGIEILKGFERKYKIPSAIYSVDQVKSIAALRREFDYSTIMVMENGEFHLWLNSRFLELDTIFGDVPFAGREQAYYLLALSCPEFVPEKVLKYIAHQELVDVLNRVMKEECSTHQKLKCGPYYPLSDRKIELDSVKSRFVDIILRCLIV